MKVLVPFVLAGSVLASVSHDHSTAHELARDAIVLGQLLRPRGSSPPTSAPSGDYAPSNATCPPQFLRQPNSSVVLAPGESAFVAARRSNAVSAWRSYLNNTALNLTGLDINAFLQNTSNLPNVAIAASGGGYRAMLHGAGLFNAFDSRNETSVKQGTGGIVQLATYLTGLSGGSWLVGSVAINNFPTVAELRAIWNLTVDIVDPYGVIDDLKYYSTVHDEVSQKDDVGFDISLTDYWGRALSRHLINNTDDGLGTTFSSIQNFTAFTDRSMPFPIIIADGRAPGEKIIPVNTTIWEFTPLEFGSWNPGLRSFIPTEYLGSPAYNGVPNDTSKCVRGFDNAGFVMGTSATLFNAAILTLIDSNSALGSLVGHVIKGILGKDNDIASYPNSFHGVNAGSFPASGELELDIVDGGEDNENVPLWPVLLPERNVDVVLALDASADTTYYWPNGSSLVQTRNRVTSDAFKSAALFPQVPADTNTYINRGLNNKTTFFGCNETGVPLVVYIPNAPYTSYTNFSTFQLHYADLQVDSFINNAMHEAAGNGTSLGAAGTPGLPTCLACALTRRALQRSGTTTPEQCNACFREYCWDGVSDSSTPAGEYEPVIPGVGAAELPGGAGTVQTPTPTPSPSPDGGAGTHSNAALPGRVLGGGLMSVEVLVGLVCVVGGALFGGSMVAP